MLGTQLLFRRAMPIPRVNSVIRLRHDVRRKRIKQLAEEGKTQVEIAENMNISYSTVKREIQAINEELNERYGWIHCNKEC